MGAQARRTAEWISARLSLKAAMARAQAMQGGKAARRPRAGFLAFCSSALTYWHSKNQASIGASSFGSELIAMKQATEYARGLRRKLRVMGARAGAPAYAYAGS